MKIMSKWLKYILFAVIVAIAVSICSPVTKVSADGNIITVTSMLTGERYYFNDLQKAFDAADRGCIVDIGGPITLQQDVILRGEVMLKGYTFIRFVPDANNTDIYYRILLAENGAIFSPDSRIRTKYIGALHSYSEVDMVEENGGYVYYLISQAPDLSGAQPKIQIGDKIHGVKVDAQTATIYLDLPLKGISKDTLVSQMTMDAKNTETVTFTIQSEQTTGAMVTNGCTVTAEASNYDYEGNDTATYTIIVVGDVNGNGMIDSADAALIAQFAAGVTTLSDHALLAADANMDGVVNTKDAKLICEKYVRADAYTSPLKK